MKDITGSKVHSFHPILTSVKVFFFIFLCSTVSHADVLTLAWDPPSQEPGLVYELCYGTNSNTYTTCIDAGNQTSHTVENLEPGVTYYFAATASNQYGESEYSQEINYTIPEASTDLDDDGDGYTESDGDCNDTDPAVHPGAEETCGDGIDQDCNGADLACPELPENVDNDGDGLTETQGDCNDGNSGIYPGAAEECGDGIDQDCSGADLACPELPENIDNDGDEVTESDGDCNDSDGSIYPGAIETCGDGIDQDCSGSDLACPEVGDLVREAEEGVIAGAFEIVDESTASGGYYVQVPNPTGTRYDGPDDTHKITYTFNVSETGTYRIKGAVHAASGSDDSFWVQVNDTPADGYLWDVLQNTSYQKDYVNDRDGADPVEVWLPAGENTVSVYLREDGTRLDSIELEPVAIVPQEKDNDGDGFFGTQGDCDDGNSDIYPGATEVCGDGIDQDCSGADMACPELPENVDNDGDGLTETQGDCDDGNSGIYPGAAEECGDGIDQDCSGADLVCPELPENIDNDGDEINESDGDCNDSDGSIYPGAIETCGDGIDQDCSGSDLACPEVGDLVREAEEGVVAGAFEIINDSAASGGYYVQVPNRTGTRYDGPDATHKMTYTFNVAAPGTYRIKGAVYAAKGSDDSFWVQINDAPADGYLWDVFRNTSYQKDYVNDRDGADPVEVWLPAGENTVSVYLREDGTRLDSIELEPVDPIFPKSDADSDDFTVAQGDCDDTDSSINPAATDLCGDGIDQDCDGVDLICENVATDTDGDGLTDRDERDTYLTDPNKADTDGDGYPDGEEVFNGFDPLSAVSNPDIYIPKIEIGEVSLDHNWLYINFNREYKDPVVVAGAASINGSDPTTVRLRNVTGNGFEICLQEWEYLDGTHVSESVGYLVMERGQYRLSDGTMIEAGTFTTKTPPAYERVTYHNTFNRPPVVVSTITSVNDPDAVVVRLRNVDTGGFDLKLQEQEANANNHQGEVISYIAWEPSAGTIDGFAFLVDQTNDEVKHEIHTIGFGNIFDKTPVFLCDMQTTDGGNTANLRWQNKDAYAVEVLVDEEQSNDDEINHITEVVGFIGITKFTQ